MTLNAENSLYIKRLLEIYRMEIRLKIIARRQMESFTMFKRLHQIIDQLDEKNYPPTNTTPTPPNIPDLLQEHNYACLNLTSDASTPSSVPLPISSSFSSSLEERSQFGMFSAKRKIFDEEQEYHEFSAKKYCISLQPDHQQQQEYPKQIHENIVLGPNGTEVDIRSYSSIIWSSAAPATRQLLGFVFSNDILATHTLTGKPSPAFYGRERPPKMQLDPIKVADIIHCVRSIFKCSERAVRAAITTKCSDTSKKYRRRHEKLLESLNAIY